MKITVYSNQYLLISSIFLAALFSLSREKRTQAKSFKNSYYLIKLRYTIYMLYIRYDNCNFKIQFQTIFDFIRFFKEYLEYSIQYSLKKCTLTFPHSCSNSGMLHALQSCVSCITARSIYHCNKSSFGFIFSENSGVY